MRDFPREWVEGAKHSDSWPVMTGLAPSLEPDSESLAWTQSAARSALWAGIAAPILVLVGRETLDVMRPAADSLVANLPHAELRAVEASDHRWEPHAMANTVAEFLVG
jgi:pimeloyl-ACP methyl ester carboxylesterase